MFNKMTDIARSPGAVPCPICQHPLAVRPTRNRSLMFVCPRNARHFRGFINDQTFVNHVYGRLEQQTPADEGLGDLDALPEGGRRSRTILERDSRS